MLAPLTTRWLHVEASRSGHWLGPLIEVLRPCARQAGDVIGTPAFDPDVWSGRASQEGFVDLSALRSCINVSGL
jgi:hypothetical protein